jgi:acetoin utilization deacetylase AcuC-like enzyme
MLRIANHPIYTHPLPKGHRFPMEKYDLVPRQLLFEGTCSESNFFLPEAATQEAILAVHDPIYLESLDKQTLDRKAIMALGLPLSPELVKREKILVGGTIKAAEYALEYGIAMNIAGGTHHAYTSKGEGFCLLNDQAIAARYLQREKNIEKILFIDLDVHQGDGTAQIFENDPGVFTFSMHGENNFPFQKQRSSLDIPLTDGTGDEDYLNTLKKYLPLLMQKVDPQFVFYQCGVDILGTDQLGKLSCTIEGCKERDRMVLQACHEMKVPVECSMGGGYSKAIRTIIEAHANTFRLAQHIFF